MINNKIVVLLPKYIGDSVMATPALQLIEKAYPGAPVTVICRPLNTAIFLRSQYSVITDPRGVNRTKGTFELIKLLKKEAFDIGFLFSNTFLDALCFKLGNVKEIAGYKKEARTFLLHHSLKIDRGRHYVNRYAHLVNSFLGKPFEKLPPMAIPFTPEKSVVQKINNEMLIGFYFGGQNKKTKHYPNTSAIKVLEHISASGNCRCILFGDKTEKETSDQLVSMLSSHVNYVDLTGKTSVTELVDTISVLDLLVTVDSSPMHIAAAVGTKFIAIYGKCPHPFTAVKPKVNFGHYVESLGEYIEDEDQMKDIYPETIAEKIHEILY